MNVISSGPHRHCGQGLPHLDRDSSVLLTAAGEIVIARLNRISVYGAHGDGWHLQHDVTLEGTITALADSRDGVLAAAAGKIHCVHAGVARVIAHVDGIVRSLTAAGPSAFAAAGRTGRHDGSLVEIDLARGGIVSERSLRSAHATLSSDITGNYVGVADGQTFQTLRMATARPCPPGSESTPPPRQMTPAAPPCGCRQPCGCKDPYRDASDPHPGADRPADPDSPAKPPATDPCDPGQSGTPTPGGGRVVGDGDGVTHHPPGAGSPFPCRSHLFFQVEGVRLAGNYIVATDRESRNLAVLAAEDLQVLHRAQFRRGAVVLSHPAQPRMLLYDRQSTVWTETGFDRLERSPLERFPGGGLGVLGDSITFTGNPLPVLRGTRAAATGVKKVLVFPAIDPGQTFNDADTPKLAAYLRRAAFSHVADYYREVSFNLLKNIELSVYGVDTGIGGPVRLPKNVADYYNPVYVGAHVDLIKSGVTFPTSLVFDGRESFTLNVQPQSGGRPKSTLNLKFSAILAGMAHKLYPAQIQFAGTEKATIFVKRPNGTNATLQLTFTPLAIDIKNDADLATALPQIETYLDGILAAAETAAGITPRLLTKPSLRRIDQNTGGPGFLVTTISHTATTGPKLEVNSISYTGASDPLGLSSAFTGRIPITTGANSKLQGYLDFVATLAQEAAGFNVNARRLADDPVIQASGNTLTSQLFISTEDGGPGATMSVSNAVEMSGLFDTANSIANTNVTAGRSNTPKDGADGFDGLVDDVFTAAADRLAPPGQHLNKKDDINKVFAGFDATIVLVVHPAQADASKPDFVRPEEWWNAGPTSWNGFRAVEGPRTAKFKPFPKEIQFFSNWSLEPLEVPPPFLAFCHEFGHALGFGDLYQREAGYRDDLIYMGNWSIMDEHNSGSHHCGYNKWQAGWIADGRVKTVARPPDLNPVTTEVLLVPVEYWPDNDAIVGQAQAAFNLPKADVVQLVELELGGDADVFGLIEARQKGPVHPGGVSFSQSLPAEPALLVTNCIVFWDPNRYAFEHRYRASVHPLHEENQLRNPGDSFDLARGKELPAKGIVVSIVDRKTVSGIEVFRVKVVRQNSNDFIDVFFTSPDPYYKNPDLWVDWAGDNGPGGKTSSQKPEDAHIYPIGEPNDQGEKIRVPDSGDELHWMVARVRNIGNVRAEQVKLNFSLCEPPGAGDRGNFKVRDTIIVPTLQPTGRDKPIYIESKWLVPAGFKGHTCIMVEVADLKVPLDETGAAIASDDVWQANNRAQKNVDQIGPAHESPFDPVDFDFSVNNSAEWPEVAYLEPEGLPYGMQLTVTPRRRRITAGETAIFRCSLQLDDKVIDASCLGDHDFRINVWRVDEDSSVPWGGVEYQVRPRKRSRTDVHPSWDTVNLVEITGNVTPSNIVGGQVRIRLAYTGQAARWVTADLKPGATFFYSEKAPAGVFELHTIALFEGNKYYSESRSPERRVTPPPVPR